VSAIDEMGVTGDAAPLRDGLLSMDVADTLRRSPGLAEAPDAVPQLQHLYRMLGIGVTEAELADGLAAYADGRFDPLPPKGGIGLLLARLYVGRRRWQPAATAVLLMLVIGFGGYFFVYKPYRNSQAEQVRVDLETRLPAEMDALYKTIFDETKVQQAVADAAEFRDRGLDAAHGGDRAGAEAAIDNLANLRDTLQLDYTLRVADRPGVKWGFWAFPEDNTEATNYYIVVEATDSNGQKLSLPVQNEQTGKTETVSIWGLRVPEEVYRAVESDKSDDGRIEHSLVGAKDFGFLEPEYTIGVLGGAVTRW
jgi:Family of unknown function (DUF6384)